MITIYIKNTKCQIQNLTDPDIIKELDKQMSYSIQGHQFFKTNKNWDGRYRLYSKSNQFPIGLLKKAESILKKNNCQYEIKDLRQLPKYGNKIAHSSSFTPRDYQEQALQSVIKNKSGIIKAGTGAGKTSIISMICANYNIKTVIYVVSIELLYQMKETLNNLYPELKIGMVGNGICEIEDITICTLWSAASAYNEKYENLYEESECKEKSISEDKKYQIQKMINDSEMLIIDECQFCSCSSAQLIHKNSINAYHRILTSGTPWRDDGSDLLIESISGPNIFDISASKLIKNGWLVKPLIYMYKVGRKKSVGINYKDVYNNFIVKNPDRNELILKVTEKLINKRRKILILVNIVKHADMLYDMLKDNYLVEKLDGKNSYQDRAKVIKQMKDNEIDIIISTKIFDQGIDISNLDALILAGGGKSSSKALQRIGRVIRKNDNKKDAIIVDFYDECKFLRNHSEARIKVYQTEDEFVIKKQD